MKHAPARSASGPVSRTIASASCTAPTSPKAAPLWRATGASRRSRLAFSPAVRACARKPPCWRASAICWVSCRKAGSLMSSGSCPACSAAKRYAKPSKPTVVSCHRRRSVSSTPCSLSTALARGDDCGPQPVPTAAAHRRRRSTCHQCKRCLACDDSRQASWARLKASILRVQTAPFSGPVGIRIAMMRP